jgi:hypothetical protein
MNSDQINSAKSSSLQRGTRYVCVLAIILALGAFPAGAQSFTSGSDGSDGAYNPTGPSGTVIIFDPTQFHGSQVGANIFNFTTITIPAGVTVRFSGNTLNGPVYWLAQGDVDIEGTVDLSGGNGYDHTSESFLRVPSVPGSGGYAGGVGGGGLQLALPGNGPGGGAAGTQTTFSGRGGTYTGNQFLIPLVGGSGGGGAFSNSGFFEPGGGGGGGAIMIASSTHIIINGVINTRGGNAGSPGNGCAGGGSGGAIRLVSNAIAGSGNLTATGGTSACQATTNGGSGDVREESNSTFFSGHVDVGVGQSAPFRLLLPTAGAPTANVISINGISISPNPNTFPDITINTSSPVPVVIQTQNIPATATLTLTILDENNVADTVVQAPPLSNCTASNVCTTTVNVTFPNGGSYGLSKVTWTLQ